MAARGAAAGSLLAILGQFLVPVAADAPATLQVMAVAPGYPGRATGDGRWLIFLDGPIDPGAAARFEQVIVAESISSAIVYVNSPGGSLVTAMRLGRNVRAHAFDTRVGTRTADAVGATAGTCHSACPFILAGGVRRSLEEGSQIGLHRAENRVPVSDGSAFQRVVATQLTGYLAEMGLRTEVAAIMSATAHDQIRNLTTAEARYLRLVKDGP